MISSSWRKTFPLWMLVLLTTFDSQAAGRRHFEEGAVGLALALRKLPVAASFLHTTAHPDDEDNPLLVALNRGRGIRTGLLTLTRGDGGQNEIGPELFEALGIIRSEELMAMHQIDGAEQFFTRAYEFGYSFSVEETLEKWGKEEILSDMVRIIRKFRPDVIVSMSRSGRGGGQHHQTSALLTEEAFRAAGDPGRFPEQLSQGLRPWQARKLYERFRGDGSQEPFVRMQTGIFDQLLGRTYAQLGFEARASHRCQGMSQLIPPPGPFHSDWRLVDATVDVSGTERDLFDGIDTSLFSIAAYATGQEDRAPFLRPMLKEMDDSIRAARLAFDADNLGQTSAPLADGLRVLRALREEVEQSSLQEDARDQIGFLLTQKEKDFVEALRLSLSLSVDVLADDGTVVPGQELNLTVIVANGGSQVLDVEKLEALYPPDWQVSGDTGPARLSPGRVLRRQLRIRVSNSEQPTKPYWHRPEPGLDRFEAPFELIGAPWVSPPLAISVQTRFGNLLMSFDEAAEYHYVGPWVGGEQRHDLMVVPPVSLTPEPPITIIPIAPVTRREIRVTVQNHSDGPLSGQVSLDLPTHWDVTPTSHSFEFSRQDERITQKFHLIPPPSLAPGDYRIKVKGAFGERVYSEGFQVIDYDHIRRRHYYLPAEIQIRAAEVRVNGGLRVGFIEGVGDHVPEALNELGVVVDRLDAEALAFGDLSQFDVIVTGIRAYLVREDLKSNNARLLKWVHDGGTLIVQYNKFEFNDAQRGDSPFAPYPARVGRGRVTDENAPIRLLLPEHPVFRQPNRIDDDDWKGWVQERGLYFLGSKSEHYHDLLLTEDPFEFNAGEKRGALVEARYGKGRYLYVGLGLWRQLPAGVPGAYRLLANLISLPAAEQN